MPAVLPPAKVLVTGANGFLALHVIKQLLEQGYSVRGTVRSETKGDWIKNKFANFGDEFEYTIVEDIVKEGAFDESLKDITAVLHTASPVPDRFVGTYETIYIPAVKATASILNSVLRVGANVRRVIYTSSFVAMMDPHEKGYTYSEKDWNNNASKLVKEIPDKLPGIMLYLAAKTDAERAAWDFVEKHKGEVDFDLVTLNPPYIFGPILQEEPNSSANTIFRKAFEEKPVDQAGQHAGFFIDVRDTARAHVLSLQKEKAGGERLFITGGAFKWQDVYDELQSLNIPEIPKDQPDIPDTLDVPDTSKAAEILGLTYRPLGEAVRDTILSIRERKASA